LKIGDLQIKRRGFLNKFVKFKNNGCIKFSIDKFIYELLWQSSDELKIYLKNLTIEGGIFICENNLTTIQIQKSEKIGAQNNQD
jgi:hypothetical protein